MIQDTVTVARDTVVVTLPQTGILRGVGVVEWVTAAVALYGAWLATMTHRARRAEKHAETLALRKGDVRARIVRSGRSHQLIVWNDGPSTARDLVVLVDGKPPLEHKVFVGSGEKPITELVSGSDTHYLMAISFGDPTVYTVEVRWNDDSGERGYWKAPLQI